MTAVEPAQSDEETMALELGEAIEQRQLRLYYQPIVSLIDRVANEVEALPRWPRDDNHTLAPADFIGVAQQFGLLAKLERWAIDTAFEQLSRWRRSTDLDVSLNLSEEHLYESDLPDVIRDAAKRSDVEPRRLSLEISETALMEANGMKLERLNEIAGIGVGLTVDDYSGALPKQDLARLPTTALKISRRVVAGIPDGPRHTETVAGAIRIAAELGLTVIANGIESPGQLAALRDMGCQFGQGFLFSIPMPAEVLAERAASR
jgi:EAL domain-containing protein (putative c-di-GMP-specific phosphodiesterase class I)